jgi:putative ABC transport system permease protein
LGKPIGEAEEEAAAGVVVLGEQVWRTRFHADPNVLGTNIPLNGRSFQIIGITPEQANEIRKIVLPPTSIWPTRNTLMALSAKSSSTHCLTRRGICRE